MWSAFSRLEAPVLIDSTSSSGTLVSQLRYHSLFPISLLNSQSSYFLSDFSHFPFIFLAPTTTTIRAGAAQQDAVWEPIAHLQPGAKDAILAFEEATMRRATERAAKKAARRARRAAAQDEETRRKSENESLPEQPQGTCGLSTSVATYWPSVSSPVPAGSRHLSSERRASASFDATVLLGVGVGLGGGLQKTGDAREAREGVEMEMDDVFSSSLLHPSKASATGPRIRVGTFSPFSVAVSYCANLVIVAAAAVLLHVVVEAPCAAAEKALVELAAAWAARLKRTAATQPR